jgi:hypothetical protein
MGGVRGICDHPFVLADDSSVDKLLAFTPDVALPGAGANLGWNVGSPRLDRLSLAGLTVIRLVVDLDSCCRPFCHWSMDLSSFWNRIQRGLPEVTLGHREQKLAISGIRAHVRHPVYLGHFCEMVAWSVGTGLAVCYALTTFALVIGAIMIRLEDRELEQRFGEEYRDYRSRVPAILPKILSK